MRIFHDRRCLEHRAPPGFPERPERLARLLDELGRDRRFENVDAEGRIDEATALAAVARIHDERYVERFRRAVERGDGLLDSADNPISAASFTAAGAATATALAALDEAVAGERAVFAAVRPPGHHAERSMAMGFCFFNHAAVAAQRALDRHGAGRIAIVDFDVHHGNGTQHLFEERADVLYASLHQYPFYPGTGAAAERGRGAGEGTTVNVPLAAGCGDTEWLAGLREVVLPAVERFAPDLLVVSAGFDAWRDDPLGGMRVTESGFASIGAELRGVAERRSGGRLLALLEGGYDVAALPRLVAAFAAGAAG
jgi:acetoin utilization deacetylase AcuC-like enzyme